MAFESLAFSLGPRKLTACECSRLFRVSSPRPAGRTLLVILQGEVRLHGYLCHSIQLCTWLEGSGCGICSLSLPEIYCGAQGHFTYYVSNTSEVCIDPPSRGRAADLMRDRLSGPVQSVTEVKAATKMNNGSR